MRKKGGKYQDYSDSNFGGRGGGVISSLRPTLIITVIILILPFLKQKLFFVTFFFNSTRLSRISCVRLGKGIRSGQ